MESKMVSFTIDGKRVEAEEGMTILQVAQREGIEIPTLCYHKDMEPYGGCRLCIVEVTDGGSTRLQPSCAFPVKDGLLVKTNTERLVRGRKVIAELLLARCPDVDSVRNLAASFGLAKTRFTESNSNCVLCGQCVRVCRNMARVGAIDFVNRGIRRYVGTPFDMPSEDCIGCGSCSYVCPTGAMKMEHENVLRWRNLPGPLRKCRYMRMGFISHKICPNNYECWNCEVDQRMEDLAKTHPVFILKQAREKEREKIDRFELLFDRMYGEGHVWVKRINGSVRMGIDDFTRQIIGDVNHIRLTPVNTMVEKGDPLWAISGDDMTLHMYTPLKGKVVEINPDIGDNPSLVTLDPYGRGWILSVKPDDILQASKELLSGKSAIEWLKRDSLQLNDLISKNSKFGLSADSPIPRDFPRTVGKSVWNRIEKTFFVKKGKKVRLRSIGDIYRTLKKSS
ncbi:MAG: 2Fe-2S iron-sulfur cluster-binding protein, partial [Pseudomonadota bacterium]